jgi:hypothetical protein
MKSLLNSTYINPSRLVQLHNAQQSDPLIECTFSRPRYQVMEVITVIMEVETGESEGSGKYEDVEWEANHMHWT